MTTSASNHHPPNDVPARMAPSGRTGGRLIRWVDGNPVPVYAAPLNKQQTSDLLTAALSCEYVGDIDPSSGEPINFDARFSGMTNAEVGAIRLAERFAGGDAKATTEILDRILGKPKQSVESVGVKMNFRDYLDMLADKEKRPGDYEGTTVDVEADDMDVLNELLGVAAPEQDEEDDKYACLEDL